MQSILEGGGPLVDRLALVKRDGLASVIDHDLAGIAAGQVLGKLLALGQGRLGKAPT